MTTVFEQKLSNETENLLVDLNDYHSDEEISLKRSADSNNNNNYGKPSLQIDIPNSDTNNHDSGVEEDNETSCPVKQAPKEHGQEVKFRKERKSFSLKRRPSIWRLFRSSTRVQKTEIDLNNGVDKSSTKVKSKEKSKAKGKIHCATSCPAIYPNGLLEYGNDASQTSDLGDSIPSTPVSTVSSTGLIEIPGLVGMHNLGNTCYFNAIIQCLAHIDIFSEYFAMDHFVKDLNNVNKLPRNVDKKKKLTDMISLIIKSIWNGNLYSLDLLQDVMNCVGAYNNQYNIFEQQDALEFFMWLIDKIHEESVKLPKKKYKELKKKKFQCNEERAVAAFASFTQYSQSYIQGLFLSQYQSTIPCSSCHKNSTTFDPYTSLSLDIPPRPKTVIFVTVTHASPKIPPMKYGFHLQRKATIHELKMELTDQAGIEHCIIVEINSCGMKKVLLDDNPLSILPKIEDCVYAVECGEEVGGVQSESDILLVVSNVERWGKENRRFGLPIAVKVSSNFTFKQIQSSIRKQMRENVRNSLTRLIREKQVRLGLRIITETEGSALFLNNELDSPLVHEDIVNSFVFSGALQMNCLYLVAEWEPMSGGWFLNNHRYPVALEDDSCAEMRARQHQPFVVDLEECLRLQTQEEKLPANDVWQCPYCRTEQHGITKKLTLWSLPDILVLHLKRFDQVQQFNGKVTTLVRFPRNGLNLSPYVATATNMINDRYRKESLKLQYQPPPQTEADCIYDLKAVCNHLGSHLNRGHYTSYCRNSVNGCWYLYDDSFVRFVSEDQVETPSAYLLFYERRKLSSRVPDKLSVSRNNKQTLQHWSLHMQTPHLQQPELLGQPHATKDSNSNSNTDQQLPPMLHVVKREDSEEY